MSPRSVGVVSLGLALSAAALVAVPAAASDGESDRGGCADDSGYVLSAASEDSRITVTASLYSDDNHVWEWRMRHNGDVSARGEVRAKDGPRSFRIERTMVDVVGPDTIVFRAVNTRTDEVCRGELQL